MTRTPLPTLDQVAGFRSLLAAFGRARRAKRGKGGEPAFYRDLEQNLCTLERELVDRTWRPDPYHYFIVRHTKERVVAEASFRDRVVHHALVAVLDAVFEPYFITQTYACRKGGGAHAAVRRAQALCREHRYFLKMDVQRYFDHIDHMILLAALRARVPDEGVAWLCRAILAGALLRRKPDETPSPRRCTHDETHTRAPCSLTRAT